jgi:hypothetical protein
MKQDAWTHTTTNAEYGTTGALGSPRAWLRRAFDCPSLDDTTFQPGSITPTEISVAGIWYKTSNGFNIPATGEHRELFRWFDVPPPEKMMRPRTQVALVPVIGVCAAVPMHEVLHWIKIYKESGATYTWWNTPVNRAQRAVDPLAGKRPRRQLDHSVVYKMLDAGKTRVEISKLLDFPKENIDYVIKKWRAGLPLYEKFQKPRIDAVALVQDYAAGASPQDLADKYTTALAYVYKLIKQQKELECQDHNQP